METTVILVTAAFLVCLVLGTVFWLRNVSEGIERSFDDLQNSINDLLRRGFHGGLLFLTFRSPKNQIYFRKYIRAPSDYGVELWLPRSSQIDERFVDIISFFEREALDFRRIKPQGPGGLEYAVVDFAKDVVSASHAVSEIFLGILNVPPKKGFLVRLENAALEDTLINGS